MAFSLNRLTLYVLISALEEDLRMILSQSIPANMPPIEVFGEELFDQTVLRFQGENGDNSYIQGFGDLLNFIDFPDAYKLFQTNKSYFEVDKAKIFTSFIPKFDSLVPVRNRVAHGRPLHFDDLSICLDLIEQLQSKLDYKWRSLVEVQDKISKNPGWVLEMNLPPAPKDRISHNLPIPDFDETGFMGRKDHLRSLRDMLMGPYPVISIIGEGGLGKSALALKIGYDLLDDDSIKFDAIVWSSAKANTVTAQEIKKIEEAVTDSLGMFKSVSSTLLGGSENGDVISEILEYLKEFKILLILDNLETVIDATLRDFFDRLPSGSKVLTTSRIGLGEFERRLNLLPMSNPEGSVLMRSVAKARGIQQLAEAPQKRLNEYSNKLKNNPGFIKWFVATVQAGIRPEKALQNTDVFLNFCLENVYDYLGKQSCRVLDVMQTVSRPLSMPELSYISELEPIRLQSAIHQLLQTNMVIMTASGNEVASETRYGLSELARSYLIKQHPVGSKDYQRYKFKEVEISKMHGRITGGFSDDHTSVFRIAVRSRSDTVIASYLIEALNSCKSNDHKTAIELVEKAKELSPGFYEVHRVDAWINAQIGNVLTAKLAYESAYELAPDDVTLMIWYGGFLQRHDRDYEKALKIFDRAILASPNNFHAKLERSRVYLHLEDYARARADLHNIQPSLVGMSKRIVRIYWDLLMQITSRLAEKQFSMSDYEGILDTVDEFNSDFERMPRYCIDFKHVRRLNSVYNSLNLASRHLYDKEISERCSKLMERISTEIIYLGGRERIESSEPTVSGRIRYQGVIVNLQDFFGFLESRDFADNVYFNRSEFLAAENSRLRPGARVVFYEGENSGGICAVKCSLLV
jgi:LuxR family transcriptional regulator, glucitol operon activator